MAVEFVVDYNDFDIIYADMLLQFPKTELKVKTAFEGFFKTGDYLLVKAFDSGKLVGYSMFYHNKKHNVFWLDYLAIFKAFHSRGYGNRIMLALKQRFKELKGSYLEVEKPDETVSNTLRRIAFYERLGAKKVAVDYYYPNEYGALPMDLYFMPFGDSNLPSIDVGLDVIHHTFDFLHKDIAHLDKILAKISVV